jgi:glycosyltransferase domain-containing protein
MTPGMTGNNSFDGKTPLSELLTVVLITHNRPGFVRRAIEYYSTLPCRVLVLDSALQPCDVEMSDYPGTDYRHLPQFGYWGIQAKLHFGVKQVTTPYMVFAADDDFIVHEALGECVDFLDANPAYGMVHGYCLMYVASANAVSFFRRDKKVCEDYNSEDGGERAIDYMRQYIPPFYAVARTELMRDWYDVMPENTPFEWQEIGHTFYLLARAKVRILPLPYVVREINIGHSDHNTEVFTKLAHTDAATVAEREAFADFLASLPTGIVRESEQQLRDVALEAFEAMADGLRKGTALAAEPIIRSVWTDPQEGPTRVFGPKQYVEMPFYNQPFFDKLTRYEFLIHTMPAGRIQMEELEGVWVRQALLMQTHGNDVPETVINRLWQAMDLSAFNREVVNHLATLLSEQCDESAPMMVAWARRLSSAPDYDVRAALAKTQSGRLLGWLPSRSPDAEQGQLISAHLGSNGGGPCFGLLLLNLDDDMDKLQTTLDSLVEGHSKSFKIVVFTTGDAPAATRINNTVHFIKVSRSNLVDKVNQAVRQMTCDWILLAEVGDIFTPAGITRASLELLGAPEIRAVSADEIQRQASGALKDVFRPGFNLDLLQSLPGMMARHWLIRRDVFLEIGGYSADFSEALEFDLLLRMIEKGGLGGLAHLDEPLLICDAQVLEENAHERLALIRHLGTRGYKALVTSSEPGTWQIDYRHDQRPQVSIIVHGIGDPDALQNCVTNIVQRTRYAGYEVLIAAQDTLSADIAERLAGFDSLSSRIRTVRNESGLNNAAFINEVARHASGEFLVLLAADAMVVNPNWLGSLLNQGLRPEVGVVGAKLIDEAGTVTQAGLILGLNGVGSGLIGETRHAPGYMHRLIVEQNYSAVSAACLMVRKDVFEAVGGLDTDRFADAYGDVDLCLKVGLSGHLIVWTPQVQVIHPGVLPDAPAALVALQAKWTNAFEHDLAYNRNLSRSGKGFTLGRASDVNWAQLLP